MSMKQKLFYSALEMLLKWVMKKKAAVITKANRTTVKNHITRKNAGLINCVLASTVARLPRDSNTQRPN